MSDITKKEFYDQIKATWVLQSGLKDADFAREVSFAMQHAAKNPYLKQCDPTSVLRAIMNVAQIGLTLNPVSKYAYLIPRYNSQSKMLECVLEPSYIGLAKLLTDSGSVISIQSQIIYEGDNCQIDLASNEKVIKHEPFFITGKEKGKIVGVYSLATLPDGSKHIEGMSYKDIMEIRERSESFKAYSDGKIKSCTWISDEGEMCRKTVNKRHTKYLPKSVNSEKLEKAIELDNDIHGFKEPMDFGMLQFLETSIDRSTIDPEKKAQWKKKMAAWEYKSDAFELMQILGESMPMIGTQQTPHSISEQGEAIRKAVERDDFYEERRNKK